MAADKHNTTPDGESALLGDSVASAAYVEIVVPLALPTLTFSINSDIAGEIIPGKAVMVQLGVRKLYMGIVWRVHNEKPDFRTKKIEKNLDGDPLLTPQQMRLWEWISAYYLCTLGEVMRAGLPSALKPEGFTHEEFERDTFKPRTIPMIGLGDGINTEDDLNAMFESFGRAKKQYSTLSELVGALPERELFSGMIPCTVLNASSVIINTLIKKGAVRIKNIELRAGELAPITVGLPVLTDSQKKAYGEIKENFRQKDVVLLHGVTGSGKTEIYINLMAETLAKGKDVLYLLPEIALTAQLIERIRHYFGERVVVYHSKFTERKRAEVYRHLSGGRKGEIIIGVRSAIFLPVNDLGLVVVDEEHENSFKQTDPAPRYHARDCAVVLASFYGAKTLLGSATPSIESYVNATAGKYGLVSLSERYGDSVMPKIFVSDTLLAAKRGEKTSHFNKLLLDKMDAALCGGQQVMLFQNRRGFSPYIECPSCGWTAGCPHCNVTLTLHKGEGALKCHYCGYKMSVTPTCPACKVGVPETRGFGTEKVEEELAAIFPSARIARLDRDTSHTQKQFNDIIGDFENHRTDILVGTQMITKGFDFSGVSLVGILNADNMLNFPDFRASERAYQLMTQVAGRAGRRETQGEVVIQTSQPTHPVIHHIANGDYEGMVQGQLAERESFFYPPYCRMISVTMKFRNKEVLWGAVRRFEEYTRPVFGRRLLGPETPAVDRVKGEHIVGFIIKIERSKSFEKAKQLLGEIISKVNAENDFRNVSITCNVDPQ